MSGEGMSDDDGANLFDSEPEDLYSDVGSSIDMQALSLHTLQFKEPPKSDVHSGGGGVLSGATGCETGEGHASDFERDDTVASPTEIQSVLCDGDLETDGDRFQSGLEEANRSETVDTEQNADQCKEFDVEVNNEEDAAGENEIAWDKPSAQILQSGSPRNPEPDHQQNGVDASQGEHDDDDDIVQMAHLDDCDQISVFRHGELTQSTALPVDNLDLDERSNPSASAGLKKMPSNEKLSDTIIASVSESSEADKVNSMPNESVDDPHETENPSLPEIHKQETDFAAPIPGVSIERAKSQVYTVESLFPVIYERDPVSSAQLTKASEVLRSADPTSSSKNHEQKRNSTRDPGKSIGSRLAALQGQLDAAHRALANLTRTSKLQTSMVETDNKNLSQRNARLKNQLAVTTADLQRSSAESAKLKTENELYATKLPRLQAELLEETSQVDHSQAQSVQTQLVVAQLKARSHVLQTRNQTLEAQNSKLTQQLRELQQQLKRKSAALRQQTEKVNKVEGESIELKSVHMQELLTWKTRMTSALQRFEHDKNKLEAEWRSRDRKELREAKERAEKATKKWRTVDATAVKLQEQLKHYKREASVTNETNQRHVTETRTLESLLRKAHKTEATLCNELASCKSRLRSLQEENRRHTARPTATENRRRRLEHQIPIELLLPLTDSSDDEDNQESQCCSHCQSVKVDYPNSLQSAIESVCENCLDLQYQLHKIREELKRVRALHSAEINAQGLLLDSLIAKYNCN